MISDHKLWLLRSKSWPWGRLTIYIEPRDLWVGAYVADNYVYVCPLPTIVFRWARAGAR